jgi:plastocyanin
MRLIHILYLMIVVFFLSCKENNEEVVTYGYDKFIVQPGDEASVESPGEIAVPGIHAIEIRGMNFVPNNIAVEAGDKVVWINKDLFAHDVTELTEKKWSSSKLEPGETWQMIVNEPSQYYCSIHLVMKGTIELKKSEE